MVERLVRTESGFALVEIESHNPRTNKAVVAREFCRAAHRSSYGAAGLYVGFTLDCQGAPDGDPLLLWLQRLTAKLTGHEQAPTAQDIVFAVGSRTLRHTITAGPCEMCGQETHWLDEQYHVRLCSTVCDARVYWLNYTPD